MLKIYLNGELENSAYDATIVNPNLKANPIIINALQKNLIQQLKITNRAFNYKENRSLVL